MAELTTKLHVKQNNTVYEVTVYDNVEEATPNGGSFLNIFNPNNNETGYIPLWSKSVSGGENHTPLSVIKNNVEYWLDTEVVSDIEEAQLYVEDNDTEIIFVYEDTTLEDLTEVSFTNANKYKIVYMNKKLNISTTILNAADKIIIPADATLYDSLKADNYWDNYIDKISFVQSYNTDTDNIGKDISANSYDTLGQNLIIDNNQCVLSQYEYIDINGTTETVGNISYKKYIIPNDDNVIYEILEN